MITRTLIFTCFLLLTTSCSKKHEDSDVEHEQISKLTFDTIPLDSFGPGATEVGVMAKINRIAEKRKADSLAAIAKAEQEKLDKEKLEKEKKLEEEKKAKEKKQAEPKLEIPAMIDQTTNTQ